MAPDVEERDAEERDAEERPGRVERAETALPSASGSRRRSRARPANPSRALAAFADFAGFGSVAATFVAVEPFSRAPVFAEPGDFAAFPGLPDVAVLGRRDGLSREAFDVGLDLGLRLGTDLGVGGSALVTVTGAPADLGRPDDAEERRVPPVPPRTFEWA